MLALFQAHLLRPLEPTAFVVCRRFVMLLLGVGLLLCLG